MVFKVIFYFLLCFCGTSFAANYSLEITQPQASLGVENRYYKTYTGLEYKVRVGVIGGLYPYTYALTVYPSGMTIDSQTGIITWSTPVESGSPHNITVSVTDSESTNVERSWTLTVSTSGFYFLDAVSGQTVAGGGLGTLVAPWKTFDDLLEAGTVDINTIAYFKTGTYDLTGLTATDHGEYGSGHDIGATKPTIWLAYPGQSPVIDFGSTGYEDPELYFAISDNDIYISGFAINNCWNFCFQVGGERSVVAWNTFTNLRNGQDGSNSAFIFSSGADVNGHYYSYIHNNSFANVFEHVGDEGGSFLKWYSQTKGLVEENTWTNQNGSNTASQEGMTLKAYNTFCNVRKNTVDYILDHSIGGSANLNDNNTYEFNLVRNCGAGEGVVINEFGTIATREDYYRNTFVCPVTVKNTATGDGPFYFTNNVIVNADTTYLGLTYVNVTDADMIVRSGDLTGVPADGITDANGLLQGAYRTTYLGVKGWELSSSSTPNITGVTFTGVVRQ